MIHPPSALLDPSWPRSNLYHSKLRPSRLGRLPWSWPSRTPSSTTLALTEFLPVLLLQRTGLVVYCSMERQLLRPVSSQLVSPFLSRLNPHTPSSYPALSDASPQATQVSLGPLNRLHLPQPARIRMHNGQHLCLFDPSSGDATGQLLNVGSARAFAGVQQFATWFATNPRPVQVPPPRPLAFSQVERRRLRRARLDHLVRDAPAVAHLPGRSHRGPPLVASLSSSETHG